MDILTSFIVIPVLTIIGLIFCKDHKQVKWTAAIGMGLQLIAAATLIILFLLERKAGNMAEMLFVKDLVWFPSLNIHYLIGVDGVSDAMIGLTSIVIFAGIFASWEVEELHKEFFISLIFLSTGVFGFFISLDLFTLFLF